MGQNGKKVDMKKAHRKIVSNSNCAHELSGRGAGGARRVRAWRRPLWKNLTGLGIKLATVVVSAMLLAFSLVGTPPAGAPPGSTPIAYPPPTPPRPGAKMISVSKENKSLRLRPTPRGAAPHTCARPSS